MFLAPLIEFEVSLRATPQLGVAGGGEGGGGGGDSDDSDHNDDSSDDDEDNTGHNECSTDDNESNDSDDSDSGAISHRLQPAPLPSAFANIQHLLPSTFQPGLDGQGNLNS